MPDPSALLGLIPGVIGAIGGSQPQQKTQTVTSTVNAGQATAAEQMGLEATTNSLSSLGSMVNAGPGQSDVTAGLGAQRGLAQMLQQYSQQGGNLPTAQDMSTAQGFAKSAFAPQQTALNQSFVDQTNAANQQAALMGRDVNDPVLRNKLQVEQMRQSSMLSANQNAFATNYAMQQPMQRLGFAQQGANVLGGLASQAMANRQALASMGSNLMANQQNFRLATATKTSTGTEQSGGGVQGALSGFMGGIGTGGSMLKSFGIGGFGQAGTFGNTGWGGGPGPNQQNGGGSAYGPLQQSGSF